MEDETRLDWVRFDEHFQGKQVPFGALLDYMPNEDEQEHMPFAGVRGVPAIFLGWK